MKGRWIEVEVRDIAARTRNAIVGGPFGSELVSKDYTSAGVPVIRGQNMHQPWVGGDFVFVSDAKAKLLEANLAKADDLIFTQRGTLGQVSLVPKRSFPAYLVSQSQMKLTVDNERADPVFYYYVFTGDHLQARIVKSTIQTGVPHINLGILRELPVPLPPLPEQRAIAKALSDVDALIDALDQLIAKKRELKTATMQQLLTGQRRLPGFTQVWETKPLGSFGSFSKGQGLAKDALRSSGDLPAIPYTAIYTDHDEVLRIEAIKDYCSRASSRVVISQPHLLIASSSNMLANIGKATAFTGGCEIAVGGDILLFAPLADVRFLSYLLSTAAHRRRIVLLSQGSTIRHVYRSTFEAYEVLLPPTKEQKAIADVLVDIDAELAVLAARIEKTKLLKQGMMQELLTGRTRLVATTT